MNITFVLLLLLFFYQRVCWVHPWLVIEFREKKKKISRVQFGDANNIYWLIHPRHFDFLSSCIIEIQKHKIINIRLSPQPFYAFVLLFWSILSIIFNSLHSLHLNRRHSFHKYISQYQNLIKISVIHSNVHGNLRLILFR